MDRLILQEISKNKLIEEGDKVLVGVSGGPDSVALLHFLNRYKSKWNITLIAVHVNHQLRGLEADEDQSYVENICGEWGIPCYSYAVQVQEYANQHQLSKQVAARDCRYQVYNQVAEELHVNKLALAHHGDDQIETVLMRLIRGAGLSGLSGMPLKRDTPYYQIIRPLMPMSKAEIEQYCSTYQLIPRVDQSNFSDDYTRNFVRIHLLSKLKELNPNIHQTIYEMTETIRLENDYLDELAKKYLKKVILEIQTNKMTINLSFFQEIPLPLQRRAILIILSYLPVHRPDWNKIHIEQLLHLAKDCSGHKQIELPNGIMAIREYSFLTLSKKEEIAIEKHDWEKEIPLNGELIIDQPYIHIKTSLSANPALQTVRTTQQNGQINYIANFDAEDLKYPLLLRTRRPGDIIQPLGMQGHKKVKNIFIDQKVPISLRDGWPVIVDQEEIIWLPGLKRANHGKVTEKTKKILTIEVTIAEEGYRNGK